MEEYYDLVIHFVCADRNYIVDGKRGTPPLKKVSFIAFLLVLLLSACAKPSDDIESSQLEFGVEDYLVNEAKEVFDVVTYGYFEGTDGLGWRFGIKTRDATNWDSYMKSAKSFATRIFNEDAVTPLETIVISFESGGVIIQKDANNKIISQCVCYEGSPSIESAYKREFSGTEEIIIER